MICAKSVTVLNYIGYWLNLGSKDEDITTDTDTDAEVKGERGQKRKSWQKTAPKKHKKMKGRFRF